MIEAWFNTGHPAWVIAGSTVMLSLCSIGALHGVYDLIRHKRGA